MRVGYHYPCSHACIRTGGGVSDCNSHSDTGKGTQSPLPWQCRYGRRSEERKRNGKQLGMDRETERNGTGQIPPVRLTACTIPSRFYGRPVYVGIRDQYRDRAKETRRQIGGRPMLTRMERPKEQRSHKDKTELFR